MKRCLALRTGCEVRERPDLTSIFLNRYLEETGDYEGLPFAGSVPRVYRSLVRAKVAFLEHQSGGDKAVCLARYERHLALAGRYAEPRPAGLIVLTHGVSGAGKTMHSATLIPRLGALRIRSDVERKRLAGLSAEAKTESAVAAGMYDAAMTERTYERLRDLAGIVSDCGIPVIVDGRPENPGSGTAHRAMSPALRARIARRCTGQFGKDST